MISHRGFLLIELVIFIIVTSIILVGLSIGFITALQNTTQISSYTTATAVARSCGEWYLNQKRLMGLHSFIATYCNGNQLIIKGCQAPADFAISGSCEITQIDNNPDYLNINVQIIGPANATISLLMAEY